MNIIKVIKEAAPLVIIGLFLGGGIWYVEIRIIYSSDPLGWGGVIGGILGGLGALGTIVFAWWTIENNNRIHLDNLSQIEREAQKDDIQELVSEICGCILELRIKFTEETIIADTVLWYLYFSYFDYKQKYALNNIQAVKGMDKIISKLEAIVTIIDNSTHKEYLLYYYKTKCINSNLLHLLFVHSMHNNNLRMCMSCRNSLMIDDKDIEDILRSIVNTIVTEYVENKEKEDALLIEYFRMISECIKMLAIEHKKKKPYVIVLSFHSNTCPAYHEQFNLLAGKYYPDIKAIKADVS